MRTSKPSNLNEYAMIKAKVLTKEQARHKAALAMGAAVRRKYRAMAKQADKDLLVDRRTKAARGMDACVVVGVARAQAGSCIAAVVGSAGGVKVQYSPALLESKVGGTLHALYAK